MSVAARRSRDLGCCTMLRNLLHHGGLARREDGPQERYIAGWIAIAMLRQERQEVRQPSLEAKLAGTRSA